MWASTFSRLALRRSSCRALRVCRRPGRAAAAAAASPLPPRCPTSTQLRGLQTPGSASLPVAPVRNVRALHEERMVEVEWEAGGRSLYPFTWLRDNCQCPLCTLDSARARKLLMSDLDVHTGVGVVEVTHGNKVSVAWPDQHASVFDAEWLKKRCFSAAARRALKEELFLNERHHWDSELRIPTADYRAVLRDDAAALRWLSALRRVGVVRLQGAPAERGAVARLAERLGYVRMTFYGPTWQVQDKANANNVAYTSGKLSLHTDYPALHFAPGLQLLHCISDAEEGGESEMVDGFHTAELLQREDPEAFGTLTSVLVDFTDTGTDHCDFMLQAKKSIIEVDGEGRVVRINYNNATRDSVLDLPVQQVQPFYRALRAFVDLTSRPENTVTYGMLPGDVLTFDNWRLLHSRRPYRSRPGRPRHLEGAYLDWDEVMSRLRILRNAVHGSV